MAKKKPMSPKGAENNMRKLFDYIQNQNFESEDELKAFLNQTIGKTVGDIIPQNQHAPSKKEEATDLVYEAYETSKSKGKKLVEKALRLDPNNVAAHTYMGEVQNKIHQALPYFQKAMELARKELGEQTFEEAKGHFWGFHETRPYMRAKERYADALLNSERIEEATDQYTEMIELNPDDNQGIRYRYAALLISQNRFEDYEKLYKQYDESSAQLLFNHAIYLFKKEGNSKKANATLLKAHEENIHVVSFLTGKKGMPRSMPSHYSWGDPSEAVIYLLESLFLWAETEGAIEWVKAFYEERKKIN